MDKELLTRKEIMELLGIASCTLYRWQTEGIVKPYKLGGKVYFKYSEILESLKDYQGNKK